MLSQNTYGMTETSPLTFASLPEDSDQLRAETVGFPMEHCEVRLAANGIKQLS